MKREENVSIQHFTSFGIGGTVALFGKALTDEDVVEFVSFGEERGIPLTILGSGTNTYFRDGQLNRAVLKIEIPGFDILEETKDTCLIEIGGGENWDTIVQKTVDMNFSGIEAMSAIPGTVGATPVQNVGAYGQEVSTVIEDVTVYDTHLKTWRILDNKECRFSYRDSIFKTGEAGRFIITSIRFRLKKERNSIPDYKDVQAWFIERNNPSPSLQEIREAVITIRSRKLPDPNVVPNMGSFFKNPIVSENTFKNLQELFPSIPSFQMSDRNMKIFAGWLIEQAGFKGKSFGNISVYEHNALVLTTNKKASYFEIEEVTHCIQKKVKDQFGIELEVEPNLVF
jgi:UDP-N-acetylmuramate dehydrogenase